MTTLKVLIPGYAIDKGDYWLASSSTTLISAGDIKIIVDPGTNRSLLLQKLSEENLKVEDINYVFITHYHPDHNLLMGIFTKATVIDDTMCYQDDKQWDHEFLIPNTDLKIIKTPGHDQFHSSLIVPTEEGNILVAGDVFWWPDDEEQKTDTKSLLNHTDPFEKNHQQLVDSRQKVLEIADWIVPGHGKMFKVEK